MDQDRLLQKKVWYFLSLRLSEMCAWVRKYFFFPFWLGSCKKDVCVCVCWEVGQGDGVCVCWGGAGMCDCVCWEVGQGCPQRIKSKLIQKPATEEHSFWEGREKLPLEPSNAWASFWFSHVQVQWTWDWDQDCLYLSWSLRVMTLALVLRKRPDTQT